MIFALTTLFAVIAWNSAPDREQRVIGAFALNGSLSIVWSARLLLVPYLAWVSFAAIRPSSGLVAPSSWLEHDEFGWKQLNSSASARCCEAPLLRFLWLFGVGARFRLVFLLLLLLLLLLGDEGRGIRLSSEVSRAPRKVRSLPLQLVRIVKQAHFVGFVDLGFGQTPSAACQVALFPSGLV